MNRFFDRGELDVLMRVPRRGTFEICMCICRIFSDLNELGFAYWQQALNQGTHRILSVSEENQVEAVEEFKNLYANSRGWRIVETMFEKFLDVSRQFKGRATLVNTISVTQIDEVMLKVILLSMGGECLYQGDCAASDKLVSTILRALPSLALSFRVASDLNVYSEDDFITYYGDDATWWWEQAHLLLPGECFFSWVAKGKPDGFSVLGGRIDLCEVYDDPMNMYRLLRLRCEDLLEIRKPDDDAKHVPAYW